jgi:hypothetical protein
VHGSSVPTHHRSPRVVEVAEHQRDEQCGHGRESAEGAVAELSRARDTRLPQRRQDRKSGRTALSIPPRGD